MTVPPPRDPLPTEAEPALPGLTQWLACALLVLSLAWALLPAGLNWDFSSESESNLTIGNLVIQLQWGSLFLVASLLCLRHFERFQSVLADLNPFLLLLFLYCLANTIWSLQPMVSLKKVIQFGGLLLIAVVFQVAGLGHARWLRLLTGTLLLFLLLSVLAVLLIPDTAIEYAGLGNDAWEGGAWRGLADQKNNYGIMAAFTVMALVGLYFTPTERRMPLSLLGLLLAFCGLNLVMSKSTTSLLVSLMGVACFMLFRWKYLDDEFVVSRVLIVLGGLLLVYVHVLYVVQGRLPTWDEFFKPVADLLGKRTDISGRFEIWDMVLQEIEHHPWLGIGYGAFWLGKGSASQPIIDKMYWVPFQAHNGYLDVFNELGLVGLLLVLAFLLWHLLTLYRLSRHDAAAAAFHGALITVILVHNLTESSLLRGVNFLPLLVLFSSVAVSRSWRQHQRASLLQAQAAQAARTGHQTQARYSM